MSARVARFVLGAFLSSVVISSAVAVAVAVAAALPASCADIVAQDPASADGLYFIAPNDMLFEVYCEDMAGTPAEYLPLVNVGGAYNYSMWAAEYRTPDATLTTHYTMVRIDPATLLVDIGDQTYAHSTPGPVGGPGTGVYSMPHATAAECRGAYTTFASANVDLTGTPFAVNDRFTTIGWYSAGSVNGISNVNDAGNATMTAVLSQVVDLTGGRACGGTAPQSFFGVNDDGGFDLQLVYLANASGDSCKHDGWMDFGDLFRNQGDCVSFFATDGRNEPAGARD